MAVKLKRPSERMKERTYRRTTPRYVTLLVIGAACAAVGISRWYFLPLGVILLALGTLDYMRHRNEQARARARGDDLPYV